MKLSKFVAKLMARIIFILLLAAGIALIQAQDKLHHLGYINLYQWRLIFPVLLIAGFIALLIACGVKKFNVPDLNWLFVVNSVMLIIYGIAVLMKIMSIAA